MPLSDVTQPHRIANRMWRGGGDRMKDTIVFRSEVPSSDTSAFLKSAESARDYFRQYGECEVVWEQHSPCNRGKSTRHTIVLRFEEAAASNRVKQKYNGRALYGARITTSWLDLRQMNELGMNKKGRQGTHGSSSSSSGGTRSHGDHYLRSKERTSLRDKDKDRESTGKHDSSSTPEADRQSTGNGSPSKEIISPTSKTHSSSRLEQKHSRHSSQSSNSSSREGRALTPIVRNTRGESSPQLERHSSGDRPESRASGHSLRESTWGQSREFDSERRKYLRGKRKHEDSDTSLERASRRHPSPSRSYSSRAKRSRQDSERKSTTIREEDQESGGRTRSPMSQSESVSSERELRPSSKCSIEKEGDVEGESRREIENEAVPGKSVDQPNNEGELSEESLVAEMESGRDPTIDGQLSVEKGYPSSSMESHLHVGAESSLLPMEVEVKREKLLDTVIERGLFDIEMKKEVLETWEQQQMYSINATEDFSVAMQPNLDNQPSGPLPPVDGTMVMALGPTQPTSHDQSLEGDVTPPLSEIGTPVHFPDFSQIPVFSGDPQNPTAASQAVMSSGWPASQDCLKRQRRIGVDANAIRQSILDEFDCNAAVLAASCKLLASHNPESSDTILSSLQSTLWKVAYSLAVKFDEKVYQ